MSPRRGERLMVPDADFRSYYGRPILKAPTWEALDIAGYLFAGGLAGGSSLLAAGADLSGRPGLRRVARLGSAGAIGVSLAALVHDLGRPARFVNMLRVVKVTSPMSLGSWLLSAYAPLSFAAAGSELTGLVPGLGTVAGVGAAALGTGVATYTAALFADTATPAWHEAHRHLPYLFASSAAAASAGLGLLAPGDVEPARRLAVAGAALELGTARAMTKGIGLAGEAYETERAGQLLRTAEVLTGAGGALALIGRRSRLLRAAAGGCLLAGSVATRFGVFRAGVQSAEDPKYVVVPQRARLAAQ